MMKTKTEKRPSLCQLKARLRWERRAIEARIKRIEERLTDPGHDEAELAALRARLEGVTMLDRLRQEINALRSRRTLNVYEERAKRDRLSRMRSGGQAARELLAI